MKKQILIIVMLGIEIFLFFMILSSLFTINTSDILGVNQFTAAYFGLVANAKYIYDMIKALRYESSEGLSYHKYILLKNYQNKVRLTYVQYFLAFMLITPLFIINVVLVNPVINIVIMFLGYVFVLLLTLYCFYLINYIYYYRYEPDKD